MTKQEPIVIRETQYLRDFNLAQITRAIATEENCLKIRLIPSNDETL